MFNCEQDPLALLETAYRGRVVSQVFDEDLYFSLVVWYDEESRNSPEVINQTFIDTPSGRRVALGQVAEVLETTGPNTINREHVQRSIVVSCNVAGRDLASVVGDITAAIDVFAFVSVHLSLCVHFLDMPSDHLHPWQLVARRPEPRTSPI